VSGCRPEIAQGLAECLNSGLVPYVPRYGSLGASGDLAPTAHAVLALMGEGSFLKEGRAAPAAALLRSAGLSVLRLEAKDGLSLLNGTPFMAGAGALLVADGWRLLDAADAIGALSVEVLLGSVRPFDARVHEMRPHRGQGESAAAVRALLQHSPMVASHANCGRVQDAYSLRCLPQVHGAARDVVRQLEGVVGIELNAGVDNPLVVTGGGAGDEMISAGNFHGAPLGMALDSYKVGLATVGAMSERRSNRLLNPHLSELPAFLTRNPGLNSGFMILQYTAAALVSENKTTAHPASVDSIPTSADQEDHVSMGWTAVSPQLEGDRSLAADIDSVARLILEGRFAELRRQALDETG
jgi:histidine ammonia-lyase